MVLYVMRDGVEGVDWRVYVNCQCILRTTQHHTVLGPSSHHSLLITLGPNPLPSHIPSLPLPLGSTGTVRSPSMRHCRSLSSRPSYRVSPSYRELWICKVPSCLPRPAAYALPAIAPLLSSSSARRGSAPPRHPVPAARLEYTPQIARFAKACQPGSTKCEWGVEGGDWCGASTPSGEGKT